VAATNRGVSSIAAEWARAGEFAVLSMFEGAR
jgi:hypothetical protein